MPHRPEIAQITVQPRSRQQLGIGQALRTALLIALVSLEKALVMLETRTGDVAERSKPRLPEQPTQFECFIHLLFLQFVSCGVFMTKNDPEDYRCWMHPVLTSPDFANGLAYQ